MARKNEHLTRKVILGYSTIVIIAIFTIIYIYSLVARVAEEKGPDNVSREKVYLITNILSLLYESETYGQLAGVEEDEFHNFNETLDKAIIHLEDLYDLTKDSTQMDKIELIVELLEQKRTNTALLMDTWTEMGNLYSRSLARAIRPTEDKPVEVVEVQKEEEIKTDTVIVQRKKRGFLKRVAEVFVPDKEDTNIIVQATSRVQTDSLVNVFNPADTIAQVIKSIQRNVASESLKLNQALAEKTADLHYNNSIITGQINQILIDIEEEEMNASIDEMIANQAILHDVSRKIAYISFILIVVVLISLYFIIRDVSRSRYYRKQLEDANQYAGELLQSREKLMLTISHDIRAPLSSIIGYIELLTGFPLEEKQKYYLDNMTVSSKHILSLVNDLLDFHRLESGQMEIQQIPYAVPVLMNEIYDSFKPLAASKGLAFNLNMEKNSKSESFLGDPDRIRQAVGNLLSNAIKFTPEGKVEMNVSIKNTEEEKQKLVISIKDEGPGISKDNQQKIFGEFTRLEGSEKTEGFGLGLSITYKLISLMGGTLSLVSEVGEGCEFTAIFPLVESGTIPEKVKEDKKITTLPKRFQKGVKCLLVDDDPLQLAVSKELLKQLTIQVESCPVPQKVEDLLKKNKYDLVITDIQMPGMDGYQLLNTIRNSNSSNSSTPVIALSASISEEEVHYREAGFTGFMNKPFTSNEFIGLLETIFPEKKADRTINISSLTSFACDDKEASNNILKTFSEETRKNIAMLEDALEQRNKLQAAAVSHKIIPVFTMLEASDIVEQLRMVENKENNLKEKEWEQILSEIIVNVNEITEQIESGTK